MVRRSAEVEGAEAEGAAGMGDPSTEGLLEDGVAAKADGSGGGQRGEGMSAPCRGSGEGEAATNFTPSSQRPPNSRRQFRTPQAIKTAMQVENPQLQPKEPQEFSFVEDSYAHEFARMEGETDSTASSPQPPLPTGRGHSSMPEMRLPKPAGVRTRASNQVTAAHSEGRPSRNTSARTSPVKVQKPIKTKRRSSRTTSDVWEYFTQEDSEDGPVAICSFCKQVYQCDRSFHGTSTLRGHLQYRCPSCPFTDHEKRRKLSLQDDHRFNAADCRRSLAKMIIIDEYPFSAVEGEGFREYSKMLQPQFEPPSRYTVARDCLNLYLEEKTKLKEMLRHQRVCLTTDTWTFPPRPDVVLEGHFPLDLML